MSDLLELITSRKSVRTFDGRPLSARDKERLTAFFDAAANPFGIPVRFVLLDAQEHGLSSPVLSGETMYVAGIVKKGPYADAAFGFSFEKLVLYAWSLGIGTTWIGGTMKRALFEAAAGLAEDEMMPCMSPLGYPAAKRSVKEVMMRKGVGADARMSADRMFFSGEWGVPLELSRRSDLRDVLEMVRWAPSAVNKQPWRIVACDDDFHFFEARDRKYTNEKTGDLQKTDVGIALCHFMTGMEDRGRNTEVVIRDPGIAVPDGAEYIATVRIGNK